MSALATEHKAVNLGQGFPDYQMSEELIALVNDVMKKGFNQYVPMQGYLPLREVLAEKIQSLYTTIVNPNTQITITPGGTYAIYTIPGQAEWDIMLCKCLTLGSEVAGYKTENELMRFKNI